MPRSTHLFLALTLASAPLALACTGSHHPGTTPVATGNLTLPLAPRVVGIRWTKVDDTITDLEVGTGPGAIPVGGKQHHRTESEILAVGADGIVTKLAVSYPERVDTAAGPDGAAEPSPLAGKSYVAWVEGGAIAATHADGSPVSAAELAELADQDELGKPPVMESIMASRTWKANETYAFSAGELMRLAESKDGKGPQATALTLTLTRVVGSAAEFAMTMKLERADGPTMTVDITGTITIDTATGRPRRIEISGPVTGDAGGMAISGTMSGLITYEFTGP